MPIVKAKPESKDDKYIIRAAQKALEALDLFTVKNSSICVSELQQALGINSNMAFRILYTLEKARYIVLNPETNKYHLSLKVFAMGRVAASSIAITKIALPYMKLLSTENPKLNISILVYENRETIIADRIPSSWLPKLHTHPGRIVPFHATAGGKVLASELPEEELERMVAEKGLESFTDHTITDFETLKKELARVRSEHIAREHEEHASNLHAIASPIRGRNDKIIAAICISGFDNYLTTTDLEQMVGSLMNTTYQISEAVRFMR
ncbi:MAG: IclR family transcriptional regulator [Planctomycetaceae bacterium]|nr:IclR family transcriptional regulator [Planctomycetaceae bacterium]